MQYIPKDLFRVMVNSNIEELLLDQSDHEALLRIVGHENEEMVRAYKMHYIVRLTNSEKLILYQATNSSDIFLKTSFSFTEHLKKCNTTNFFDLLFLCTSYPLLLPSNFRNMKIDEESPRLPFFIREILQVGNGHLLYYNQLEILFSTVTNRPHNESILFRKDWNLKKDYTRDLANSIFVTPTISLNELIISKTITRDSFVYQPNFHGANNLYNAINST